MKIAFQNRQRRLSLDIAQVRHDFETLSDYLAANLSARPPAWLEGAQIKSIFDSPQSTLSVALVSNRVIRELNKQWRGIDKATDVLSFPLELDAPQFLEEDWQIGDVIISAEKALAQAEDYGHSLERELAFLFVHGFLHVLGFDHVTKKEEQEMFGRQNEILSSAGFKR